MSPQRDQLLTTLGLIFTVIVREAAAQVPGITVTSMEPRYGPKDGGTLITVKGQGFIPRVGDRLQGQLKVMLGSTACAIVGRNTNLIPISDSHIHCTTGVLRGNVPAQGVNMSLSIAAGNFLRGFPGLVFEYRPTPVVTNIVPFVTIIDGGTILSVLGRSLHSAARPILELELEYTPKGRPPQTKHTRKFANLCRPVNQTTVLCPTPKLDLPAGLKSEIGLDAGSTNQGRVSRARRQTSTTDQQKAIDDIANVKVSVDLRFDGVLATYSKDNKMFLKIYRTPKFARIKKMIYHRLYWPNEVHKTDVQVIFPVPKALEPQTNIFVGESICGSLEIYQDRMRCLPPDRKPKQVNDGGTATFRVGIGDFSYHLGFMRIEESAWDSLNFRTGLFTILAIVFFITLVVMVSWLLAPQCAKCKKCKKCRKQ